MGQARDRNTEAIIDEAAEWIVRLSAPADGPEDRRRFIAWLKRSPVHLAEYLRMERTWADLAHVDPAKKLSPADLLERDDAEVVALRSDPGLDVITGSRASRRPVRLAAALGAGVLLATAAVLLSQVSWLERYTTGIGERRTVELTDGSTVVLNTGTQLRVDFDENLRQVRLLKGEALFGVAKDPLRPFRVVSDRSIAQAVGTSFVVRRKPTETVVTVLEGEVDVASTDGRRNGARVSEALRISAGSRADVLESEIRTRTVPNLEAVAAWKDGRLIFEGETLAEVVAEFNRYNEQQIVLRDWELAGERLSGVFDADKPQALVRFLERADVVKATHAADGKIVLLPHR